jgi:integrase
VPCSWYFGTDDATALTDAAAKMAEWAELKRQWQQVLPAARAAYPRMPLDMPFWIAESRHADVQARHAEAVAIVPRAGSIAQAQTAYEGEMLRRLTLIGQRRLKSSTVRASLTDLREGLRPLGDKMLIAITTSDLRALVDAHFGRALSDRTGVNYCRAVWRFLQWASDVYQFPLPPRSREVFTLRTVRVTPHPPTLDEVRTMYAEAAPRLKAWMMLALNCGMYESDIAALRWSNLQERAVVWRRQKTSHQNDFDLHHDLWLETIAGIEAHGDRRGELLFVHTDGKTLHEYSTETHRHIVSNHVDTVNKRLGTRFQFKGLRKFGASWFATQRDGVALARLYLGHQPPGMLSAYVRDDYARMNKMLAKFREYLLKAKVFEAVRR